MNIIKNFLTLGFSSIINIIISLLTTPIITRIVDPIEYGRFNMFTTHTGVLASFMYFGLNEVLYRFFYTYDDEDGQRRLLKICICIPASLCITVFAIGLFLYVNDIISIDYSLALFICLGINVFITVWNTLSNEMLHNTKQTNIYSFTTFLQKVIYSILSVVLIIVIKNNYLLILVLMTILSTFISSLIGTYATRKFWKFDDIKFPDNKLELIKYSIPVYLYFVIYSIYDVLDKTLVEKLCTDIDVGLYTGAFSIVGLFSIVQIAFYVIWKPMQTEHYTKNPDDKSFIQKGNKYMTIIMFFVGINMIMFKDLLFLFLGKSFREGSNLLPFLVFNPIMNVLINTVISGIEYSKKSYLRTITIILSLVLELLCSFYLIPKYGPIAAGFSATISLIFQYYLTMYFSNKYYYIDYDAKKLSIIIVLTLVFASIASSNEFNVKIIIAYLVTSIVFFVIYWNDIKEAFDVLKNTIIKKE